MLGLPFLVPALAWMSWLVAGGLVGVVARPKPRAAFLHGWLAGFAFFAVVIYWIPQTIARFSPYALWLSTVMFVSYCALAGLQFAAFGYITAKLKLAPTILVYPVVWVALELLWPSIFPWQVGNTQSQWITLIQVAELTGVYGISFVMLWFGAIVHRLVPRLWRREALGELKAHLIGLAVVMMCILCFGWWRTGQVAAYVAEQPSLRIALIQPGERPWIENCRKLSREIEDPPDLLCWPESAVPELYKPGEDDLRVTPNTGLSSSKRRRPLPQPRSHLLFGATSLAPAVGEKPVFYVSALLADTEEQVIGRYHKRSLVPFGEFIPGERWIPALHGFSAFGVRFIPGPSHEPLEIPGLARLGVLICYEDIVPQMARASAASGANVLINLTNDFWFGQTHALQQHLRLAVFRAVENKRYLLRSTTTGATAVISPTGEIIDQLPPDQPAALVASVQPLEIRTFYTLAGNVFAWACCLGVVAMAWRRIRCRKGSSST